MSKPNLRLLFSSLPHKSRLAGSYLSSLCLRLRSCPVPQTSAFYGEDYKSGLVISMSCCSCLWLPCPCKPAGADRGRGALQPQGWFQKAAPWRCLSNPSRVPWIVLRKGEDAEKGRRCAVHTPACIGPGVRVLWSAQVSRHPMEIVGTD